MLVYRHPFDHAARFERDFDHLFRRSFGFGCSPTTAVATPLAVMPDAEGVTVRAELPGIDPAAITVSVEGRMLTIDAQRQVEKRENGQSHLCERTPAALSHAFRLADDLDAEAISAKTEHGVLTIRIPKRAEAKPRQIPIQSS